MGKTETGENKEKPLKSFDFSGLLVTGVGFEPNNPALSYLLLKTGVIASYYDAISLLFWQNGTDPSDCVLTRIMLCLPAYTMYHNRPLPGKQLPQY